MTTLLLFLGLLFVVIGGLMLLVATFRVGIGWGVFCFIFPPLQFVFVFKYWDESRSAIVTQTIGLLLLLAAVFMGGNTFTTEYKTQFNRYLKQAAPEQMQEWKELQSMMSGPDMRARSQAGGEQKSHRYADGNTQTPAESRMPVRQARWMKRLKPSTSAWTRMAMSVSSTSPARVNRKR
jgi:hypothetical protein